jgi:uncharacterized protein (DUF1778 family)
MIDPEKVEEAIGDMSDWEEIPNAVRRHKATSVFSLRIQPSELSLIQKAARRRGESLSEFIRKAAVREAAQDAPGQIAMSRDDAARLFALLDSAIAVKNP